MQGQTAVHSAASVNFRKVCERDSAMRYQDRKSEENIAELVNQRFRIYAHVNLLYEPTVSTLVAHAGAGILSERDDQVWSSTHPHFVSAVPRCLLD